MTQRVRLALSWIVFLGLGVWLNARLDLESGSSIPPATPVLANQAAITQKLATLQIPFIANQGQRFIMGAEAIIAQIERRDGGC